MKFNELCSTMYISDIEMVTETEKRNENGDTPLLQCVKEYLRQVHLTTDDFDTDLADSIIEMLDILVHKKANLNAQDRHFKTALILLASSPSTLKVVRYLVEAGASTLYISGGGFDCIDEAVYYGNMEVARYLQESRRLECLRYDAKVNTTTSAGNSSKRKWTTFWRFF